MCCFKEPGKWLTITAGKTLARPIGLGCGPPAFSINHGYLCVVFLQSARIGSILNAASFIQKATLFVTAATTIVLTVYLDANPFISL